MLVTLYRFLPSSLANIHAVAPRVLKAEKMTTRGLGTIGGVFGQKEKAEEDAWFKRLEQEDLRRQASVRKVAGAVEKPEESWNEAAHVVHNAHQVEKHLAKKELNSLLENARHIAPQHVKDALIKWKMEKRERINFSKMHEQALGEEQDLEKAYDYTLESIPVTPSSGPAKYEYEPDINVRKIDKRSKEYRMMKQRIIENAALAGQSREPSKPASAPASPRSGDISSSKTKTVPDCP